MVMETIDLTLKYYSKKLNYNKPIKLPKKLIDDIVKRADDTCWGADYINHKIYTYIIEYAIKNNEPLPECYADWEDIGTEGDNMKDMLSEM
jgi:hypothetical protein